MAMQISQARHLIISVSCDIKTLCILHLSRSSLYYKQVNPQLKLLFMSGYTAGTIAHHGVLDAGINFIQKPFSLPALATKVREVLDS